MASQNIRYKTQWAAQFFAAAELTRRGYLVSLTFGNATISDLLVQSPKGTVFTVDVKGQSNKSFWLIQQRKPDPLHYFVLVYLPPKFEAPRFFVLSSDELMRRRDEYRESVIGRGKYRDELGGMNWTGAFPYEGKWDALPE